VQGGPVQAPHTWMKDPMKWTSRSRFLASIALSLATHGELIGFLSAKAPQGPNFNPPKASRVAVL
jgi:hypothetical protein